MELKTALPILESAISRVWSQIGFDVLECAEQCGESVDNYTAVESCLDADRLVLNGNDRVAQDLYRALIKEHGYGKLIEFLAKNVRLN